MVHGPNEIGSADPPDGTRAGTTIQLTGAVLLAEDGRDNQLLVATMLRRHGLAVVIAEDGRAAVDRALEAWKQERPFDLVLMDIQMPTLDGYGATLQLRASGYTRPIIAFTAHAMGGERERCLAAGFDGYLTKPIDRTALLAAVRECVTNGRAPVALAIPDAPYPVMPLSEEPLPLISSFADDPEMTEIVGLFVGGLASRMAALRDALHAGDIEVMRRLAHQLRGAGAGYGFASITDAAARLEDAIAAGADASEIARHVVALGGLCARTSPGSVAVRVAEPSQSVLVIDDSILIHELIEARLRSEGLLFVRAFDSTEGFALAVARRPDLVLLDLDLPGTTGLDLCRRLKSDPATIHIPVVFLTSASDPAIKSAALDLGAIDYVTKPFDPVELRARIRAALRTKRYQDLLSTRAQVDGLTGLWNRSYFDARVREEVTAAIRYRRPLALAMVDVDHFMNLNDAYGHPFGDLVLQRIGAALTVVVRTSDVVCRYGGEELVVIMRETAGDAAFRAAERMCEGIAAIRVVHKGQPVSVTASVGVASSDEVKPLSHEALLRAADQALYRAKSDGRNRASRAP
jgi:diguanylate cyclase (GGDEF)-like protein